MYSLSREGMHTNEAYATAVVLLIVVLIINGVSSLIAKNLKRRNSRMEKKWQKNLKFQTWIYIMVIFMH